MTGSVILDIVPSSENMRNSEGAFIALNDKRILFAYSRYGKKGCGDGSEADIFGIISDDNGKSFGKAFPIITHEALNADNIMSVSLMRMQNGDIGMFLLKKSAADCICLLLRSSDDGKSWSEPTICSDPHGYFVVNNDRILRCKSGRLVIPAAHHEVTAEVRNGKTILTGFGKGSLSFFVSDDDGRTWRTSAKSIKLPESRAITTGVQEPGLIELSDKRLWCWIRNDSGRQYECFSSDEGESWTEPQPSCFTSPQAPLSMKRLKSGKLLAVWNPIPLYNGSSEHRPDGFWTGFRSPFVIAFSSDEGNSWSKPIKLEEDSERGFCYTAIYETLDDGLLLAYCAGGREHNGILNRIRIRRFDSDELQSILSD